MTVMWVSCVYVICVADSDVGQVSLCDSDVGQLCLCDMCGRLAE